MTINEYIEKYQQPIFTTFTNAINSNTLSHAYLLSGAPGTPLKEIALTLAKTLFCEKPSPLSCNKCLSCHRFDESYIHDFIFLDGSKGNILINDIRDLSFEFSKTAIEKRGLLVYVIHLAEKLTPEAANALLKFLEEPSIDICAFLTTENEDNVLPTIISRSQKLLVKQIPREITLQKCDELEIPRIHSELIVNFYNYPDTILEVYRNEEYLLLFALFNETLKKLSSSIDETIYYLQTEGMDIILKSKNNRRFMGFYIRLFVILWGDLLNYKIGAPLTLNAYKESITKIAPKFKNIDYLLTVFLESYNQINRYVNLQLLRDHLLNTMYKERING